MNDADSSTDVFSTISVFVYGLGAIGSFYAFILQRNPQVRLTVAARSTYAAVASHGVHIDSENHGTHVFHPVGVVKSPNEAAGQFFDFVVCANKATDLAGTVDALRCIVTQEGERTTTIVLMQNGVGIEDPFREAFPECTVLSGVVWVGATQTSPGHVKQHISEDTTLGIFTPQPPPPLLSSSIVSRQLTHLNTLTHLLTTGGTPVTVVQQIQTHRWQKTIWNAAWNSLTTLTGVDVHSWLASSDHAITTTTTLMHEAVLVARAAGVPGIDDTLPQKLIARMQAFPGPVWTSMYHDAAAGRDMEVDAILGGIVREADRLAIPIPTLRAIYAMLSAVRNRVLASS